MQLKVLINNAKSRRDNSLEDLIMQFKLLIKKYSRLLDYEDAESDLILYFIELIDKIPVLKQDEAYVSYIHKSIVNKYLRLRKSITQKKFLEVPLEDCETLFMDNSSKFDVFVYSECVHKLPYKQNYIIYKLYYQQYSEIEIARQMDITKQAVNKAKKRALLKLKEYMEA